MTLVPLAKAVLPPGVDEKEIERYLADPNLASVDTELAVAKYIFSQLDLEEIDSQKIKDFGEVSKDIRLLVQQKIDIEILRRRLIRVDMVSELVSDMVASYYEVIDMIAERYSIDIDDWLKQQFIIKLRERFQATLQQETPQATRKALREQNFQPNREPDEPYRT